MKKESPKDKIVQTTTSDGKFNVAEIRSKARQHLADGAVTDNYAGNKEAVINLLQTALSTEWICVLRYTQHQISADGIHAEPVARHFAEHAAEEQGHAMQLAVRIKQLGGTPSFDPTTMTAASHSEYKECDSLSDMIRENLVAERIAVHSYTEMIRFIGDTDPTTVRMLKEILATEEEHADELASLLVHFDESSETGKQSRRLESSESHHPS
jgi:bacterioferritin